MTVGKDVELVLDPGALRIGAIDLFPADGEYAATIAGLADQVDIPDDVFLHEYAYELLERLRAQTSERGTVFQAPFWPECLFDAADISAHAAREVQGMFPRFSIVRAAPADVATITKVATRILGACRIDPVSYGMHLQAASLRRGFQHEGAPFERATAAGIFIRNGRVLLERRPDDAKTCAGLWDIPGGHLDDGEGPEETLLREMREELGVDLGALQLVAVQDDDDPVRAGAAYRHFLYLAWAWRGDVVAAEGQQLTWFPIPDAMQLDRLNPLIRSALSELVRTGRISSP